MVVMQGCCSGTGDPILATGGLLRVRVAEKHQRAIKSLIGMVSSWRTFSTFVKDAIART